MQVGGWFERRFLDLLGSIYIYNEHRGYTAIDRVLTVVRARSPEDEALIAALEKHRADEHKHFRMFRRWFERRGVMPFAIDRTCGHIDRFVEIIFGTPIDRLSLEELIASDEAFGRLCRVVALTERRGYRHIHILLRNARLRRDPALIKIFDIIRRDEPSHWEPYEGWLIAHRMRAPNLRERIIDRLIHAELMFVKLPLLFFTPRLARRTEWADAREVVV